MSESWQQQVQQQIIDLQTQLAFQEELVQALDRVVIAQQKQLDQLELANVRLEKQLIEALASLDDDPVQEVPPHY